MVFFGLGFVVASSWDPAKNMWHSGYDIKIDINSQEKSLQGAIDDGDFSCGGVEWYYGKDSVEYTSDLFDSPVLHDNGGENFVINPVPFVGGKEWYIAAECPDGMVPINCAYKMTKTASVGALPQYQAGYHEIQTTGFMIVDQNTNRLQWGVSFFDDEGKCWLRMHWCPAAEYPLAVLCQ
ncbi:MAG: hypothetical protein U9M95_03440 [Candidatus Altiarchaeota archaeon]|nr:hypothetical protein [Candidatus Altiarchaeota archaeon]